ncbi:MAG: ABC transporter substrate-binding protein [Chloroflexi bacterium]|nr:ABC transporter substrate-binding protein [Chloroflexota bacterium]
MVQRSIRWFLVCSVLLTACGGTATATSAPPAQAPATTVPAAPEPTETPEPDVVILGISRAFTSLPLYIALEEGYFAEQNIIVEFTEFERTNDMLPLLATGDLDVATGSLNSSLFNLVAQEPGVKIAADKGKAVPGTCVSNAVIARRDLIESGAFEDAQRVLSLVYSLSPTTPTSYIMDSWLRQKHGLSLADLNFNLLPQAAVIDAFNTGAIDAAVVVEPTLSQVLQATDTEIFLSYEGYLDNISSGLVIYGTGLVVENREVGQRFMVAFLKGVRQYLEGPTDRNLEIASAVFGFEPEFLRTICWQSMDPNGRIDYTATLPWQEWEVAADRIDRIVTEAELWDPAFVEYAVSVLGE